MKSKTGVVIAKSNSSTEVYAIHIVRPADLRKRLEMVVRDFVVSNTGLPADQAVAMIASRTPAREIDLSEREIEILRLLARGDPTRSIADGLNISRTTVNNHVQRILRKLTRLEAIRRAEHAGFIQVFSNQRRVCCSVIETARFGVRRPCGDLDAPQQVLTFGLPNRRFPIALKKFNPPPRSLLLQVTSAIMANRRWPKMSDSIKRISGSLQFHRFSLKQDSGMLL